MIELSSHKEYGLLCFKEDVENLFISNNPFIPIYIKLNLKDEDEFKKSYYDQYTLLEGVTFGLTMTFIILFNHLYETPIEILTAISTSAFSVGLSFIIYDIIRLLLAKKRLVLTFINPFDNHIKILCSRYNLYYLYTLFIFFYIGLISSMINIFLLSFSIYNFIVSFIMMIIITQQIATYGFNIWVLHKSEL